MTTLDTTKARAVRPHAHKSNGLDTATQCPYCGQPVSRKEFEEIRTRIEGEERARVAKVEQTLRDRFAHEQQQAAAKAKAELDRAKRDAAKAAEAQIRALRASQEATIAQRVQATREGLERKLTEAVTAEKTKAYEERMKLDAQLADLQRRVNRRTAGDLGDEAEIDLFDTLKAEFPHDQIERVAKGAPGADIIHRIVHNGTVAGTIVYDCKNHKRWQHRFTAKLRLDAVAHEADHAILSTAVFPAGTRQLHIQDGVIVAAPARVVVIAHMLRRQIVQVHALRLGNEARVEKTAELYEFIVSDRCSQLLDRIGTLSSDVLELDAKEETTHRTVWKKRSELIRAIQSIHGDFTAEIDRIIGAGP